MGYLSSNTTRNSRRRIKRLASWLISDDYPIPTELLGPVHCAIRAHQHIIEAVSRYPLGDPQAHRHRLAQAKVRGGYACPHALGEFSGAWQVCSGDQDHKL